MADGVSVDLLDALDVDATRAVLAEMPVCASPDMKLHGISSDDAIVVCLVSSDKTEVLFKEVDPRDGHLTIVNGMRLPQQVTKRVTYPG